MFSGNIIWWIICAAVVAQLYVFGIQLRDSPIRFQSNISMYVKNSEKQNQEQQGINNNDLTVSKSLVSTYIFILNNDVVMDEVGNQLAKEYTAGELVPLFHH